MPPGGDFRSNYVNFSAVETWNCIKATRLGCGLTMHDVVKFQGDLDEITGDIRDFVDTVSANEMEVEYNLVRFNEIEIKSLGVDTGSTLSCIFWLWRPPVLRRGLHHKYE